MSEPAGPEETKFIAWIEAEVEKGMVDINFTWGDTTGMSREDRFRAMNEFNAAPRKPWSEP